MNLTPIGLHDFAPQSTRHLRLPRKATKHCPIAALGSHTSPYWNSFTLKHSSDVNVSMCVTLYRFIRKPSLIFRWDPLRGGTMSKTCQSIYHAESHFDTSWKVPLHSSCRKKEGAIATCSDTLTTAGSHQSYSKSIDPTQSRSNLAFCQTWLLTLSSANICIPLSCISRVGNRFARQKHLFLQFQFTSSRATTEAVRQHAGNRLWDLFWASNRLLVSAGVMVFACWLVLFACAYAWIDVSKSSVWNFRNGLFWVEVPDSRHIHFFEQQGPVCLRADLSAWRERTMNVVLPSISWHEM